jgi:dipeptidyl aminopeptidase/acylaminoacyl peptidase
VIAGVKNACQFSRARIAGILFACALFFVAPELHAQDKPIATIDLDCRAFAIASDGRIACAAYRLGRSKKYNIERDDIWMVQPNGKRKKIVDGEKLVQSPTPFSYKITRLSFSPDGHILLVEMMTLQVIDAAGKTQAGKLVDIMNDDGKEIQIAGTKTSAIMGAFNAAALADGQTIAYLTQPDEESLFYTISTVRPLGGRGGPIFQGHNFTTVVWDPAHSSALAIERNKDLSGPIQLVRLDLLKETDTPITTLPAFLGQLTISPSGDKVAYFRDGDTLEIRSLASPANAISIHCAYGKYAWAHDGQRLLLKRGPEDQSADLVWIAIPSGTVAPILHDLIFRNFAISPDGRTLAVVGAGNNNLITYALPQ